MSRAVVVLAVVLAAVASAHVYSDNVEFQMFQFKNYVRTWSKKYASVEEEKLRFHHFVNNLKLIDARNALERASNGTAVHGMTQFTDLSEEEFFARFLTTDPSKATNSKAIGVHVDKQVAAGTNVDWTGVYTTPVKDQGYCGSCWAFSATEQLESDSMRVLGTSYILSPQQIVSCDTAWYGCSGGWPSGAFDYIQQVGGQEQESAYPYTSYYGDTGSCSSNKADEVVSLTSYYQIKSTSSNPRDDDTEAQMTAYTQSTGTLSICVDASTWSSYTGGIMSKCGTSINHAVQAVGVNTDEGITIHTQAHDTYAFTHRYTQTHTLSLLTLLEYTRIHTHTYIFRLLEGP